MSFDFEKAARHSFDLKDRLNGGQVRVTFAMVIVFFCGTLTFAQVFPMRVKLAAAILGLAAIVFVGYSLAQMLGNRRRLAIVDAAVAQKQTTAARQVPVQLPGWKGDDITAAQLRQLMKDMVALQGRYEVIVTEFSVLRRFAWLAFWAAAGAAVAHFAALARPGQLVFTDALLLAAGCLITAAATMLTAILIKIRTGRRPGTGTPDWSATAPVSASAAPGEVP